MSRLGQALARAHERGVDRLDAQLLAGQVLDRSRSWVIAHDDDDLSDAAAAALEALVARRAAGEPLAYLLARREFHGLTLRVTPDVLVPRPDTETLVTWALECLGPMPAPRVLDLGTGSGAIALAVKHACRRAEVHASDVSCGALAVARANGAALALEVSWHLGAWWQAVAAVPPFHVVLSNPPYVAAHDPHLAALRHEPALALTPAGDRGDGLADLERIADGAAARIVAGGWLLLEHGAAQAAAVQAQLANAGFVGIATRCDLAGRPRVTGGRRDG